MVLSLFPALLFLVPLPVEASSVGVETSSVPVETVPASGASAAQAFDTPDAAKLRAQTAKEQEGDGVLENYLRQLFSLKTVYVFYL